MITKGCHMNTSNSGERDSQAKNTRSAMLCKTTITAFTETLECTLTLWQQTRWQNPPVCPGTLEKLWQGVNPTSVEL